VDFNDLVKQRWSELQQSLGLQPGEISLTWEVNNDYPHFKKKRGYAVCFYRGGNQCHLRFSTKMLKVPMHRADAIVRHELGHVVDFVIPAAQLDAWASMRGVRLPHTDERRADALALATWRTPIYYDQDLVQSTRVGTSLRPAHLGL
jgi:hypothetical protein